MKLEMRSFRSRVARRIFLLFIVCAIIPISALALVSYVHVRDQLNEQSRRRLSLQSKSVGVSVYERLVLLRAEMQMVASLLNAYPPSGPQLPAGLVEKLKVPFEGLVLCRDDGKRIPLLEGPMVYRSLGPEEKDHIGRGEALLSNETGEDRASGLYMSTALRPGFPVSYFLCGKIMCSYLWRAAEGRPPMTEIVILDHSGRVLFTTLEDGIRFSMDTLKGASFAHSGDFEFREGGREYYASYRSVNLTTNFMMQPWLVVLCESKEDVFAPMADFKLVFTVILICTIAMVFLLSTKQIRKSMIPISILHDATERIANGSFGHRVEIDSRDEFQDLGASFNEMSRRLKEGQALLIQAAKMGAMGQMAAGIVHEIKQPLTAIHGLIGLTMMDSPSERTKEHLETIKAAVERLTLIVGKFGSFYQKSEERFESLSLESVIDRTYQLLAHQFSMKKILCTLEKEEELPEIFGDEKELQQVLTNLLINAMDALEEKGDGEQRITIRTFSSEKGVFMEVEDNGSGIPEDNLKSVFDPFFTTKGDNRGTGLGLAIIESILHKHHATVRVESEVGKGTKFIIAFPGLSAEGN